MKLLTLLCLLLLLSGTVLSAQEISTVEHLGREHYQIKTKAATYLYDPIAGGFSSIIDAGGKDWIAYRDEPWGEYPASAASSFRGLPNLIFLGEDEGAGHPGHKKCKSELLGTNAIKTETLSGDWAWTWTFYTTYAKLEVIKVQEGHPYWFLYEGPAGGRYQPKLTSWGTNIVGPRYDRFDHFKGSKHEDNYRWFYFNGPDSQQTFWMAHAQVDTLPDHYSLLGNQEAGIDSQDGMVVAGFGRTELAKPLLTGLNTFYIGFFKKPVDRKGRHRTIGRQIKRLLDLKE